MIKFLRPRQGHFWPFLFTFVTVITLVFLGFWQLKRMSEKQQFLANLKTNLINDPIELDLLGDKIILASKIIVKGHFLAGYDIHLYGKRSTLSNNNGYYLISPFKIDQGKIIMVARGWFDQLNKSKMSNIQNPPHQAISGVTLTSEKQRLFLPPNDLKNNVWFTLDLEQIAAASGLDIENYYLLSFDQPEMPPNLEPISSKNLLAIRNDHLQYAITWFALALAISVIYVIYARKN